SVWYVTVAGDGTIEGADNVIQVGGPFAKKEDAEKQAAQWDADHRGSARFAQTTERSVEVPAILAGSVTSVLLERYLRAQEAIDTVRCAKETVDRARSLVEGGSASERQLADTVKEYADRVAKSY